uniref:SLC26A/SulP transporter domain-containing protein n=1 Tax=Phaeomonas parva TaxID=124430 RepID=A0A6U4EDN8_9STRA|mmetsp:Transcript_20225/g.61386  ORF Transcript_20225/g.61386 Transcript_20225/m.61386 type:complete len:484 (+) Transcript_20225:187-1638(+)
MVASTVVVQAEEHDDDAAPSSGVSALTRRALSLTGDVIAGVTMATVGVPQLVACSELSGLPGYRGLLSAGLPMLAFGLTTGHPWLCVGVTSVSALMTKENLDGEDYTEAHGVDAYVRLVSVFSLVTGALCILFAYGGLGEVAREMPKAVAAGFTWGASVTIVSIQAPDVLFGHGRSFVAAAAREHLVAPPTFLKGFGTLLKLAWSMVHVELWNIHTMCFAAVTLFVLLHGRPYLPKACPKGSEVLLITALATMCSAAISYRSYGGVVGEVPGSGGDGGQHSLAVPTYPLPLYRIPGLLLSAALCAMVNFTQTVSICASFEEAGVSWGARRELFAQGASCVVAGMTGSPPMSASLSRSEVQKTLGTSTRATAIVNGLILVFLLPAAGLLEHTPKAVLASIIIASIIKKVFLPVGLLELRGQDALIGWVTGATVALATPTIGLIVGLIVGLGLERLAAVLPAVRARFGWHDTRREQAVRTEEVSA